jgi:hypothetical protein
MLLAMTTTTKAQELVFEVDNLKKEFIVKVGKLDDKKSEVELEIKCHSIIIDYKNKNHTVEILNIKQKISNGGKVFFGGELVEGEYVITLSYLENGKKIKKIEKKVVKNLTN